MAGGVDGDAKRIAIDELVTRRQPLGQRVERLFHQSRNKEASLSGDQTNLCFVLSRLAGTRNSDNHIVVIGCESPNRFIDTPVDFNPNLTVSSRIDRKAMHRDTAQGTLQRLFANTRWRICKRYYGSRQTHAEKKYSQ